MQTQDSELSASEPALRRAARLGDGWISVQATTAEIRRVASDLARFREEFDRGSVPFDLNVLPIDIVPNESGRDSYAGLAAEIVALGMNAIFQLVPWYFTGGDPDDLSVRREAIQSCGAALIA